MANNRSPRLAAIADMKREGIQVIVNTNADPFSRINSVLNREAIRQTSNKVRK